MYALVFLLAAQPLPTYQPTPVLPEFVPVVPTSKQSLQVPAKEGPALRPFPRQGRTRPSRTRTPVQSAARKQSEYLAAVPSGDLIGTDRPTATLMDSIGGGTQRYGTFGVKNC